MNNTDNTDKNTKPSWDDYFVGFAKAAAVRSTCTRRNVGAVLVVNNRVVGTGYNGAAPGEPECIDGGCPRGRFTVDEVPPLGDYDRIGSPGFCVAIHGEVNALLNRVLDVTGGTIYITDPPCPGCRKAIAAAGILRAVWPGENGKLCSYDRQQLTDWNLP